MTIADSIEDLKKGWVNLVNKAQDPTTKANAEKALNAINDCALNLKKSWQDQWNKTR